MSEKELIREVCLNNNDAIAFIEVLARASQAMDDMVDMDKPLSRQDKQTLFWDLLITLPSNPFYLRHQNMLMPVMANALNDWFTGNELERQPGNQQDLMVAYVLRDNLAAVVSQVAWIVGGPQWMHDISPRIRRFVHDEPLTRYMKNLENDNG